MALLFFQWHYSPVTGSGAWALVLWVCLVCIDFYLSSCITQFEYFLLTRYSHPLYAKSVVPILISFRPLHAQQHS